MNASVFRHFQAFHGSVDPEFSVDYIGVKVRWEYTKAVPSLIDPSKPIPPMAPHEEYFEWLDLLEAVHDAERQFTMLELGANWGRWGLRGALAARQRGLAIRVGFAEPEPVHLRWLEQTIADNGLSDDEAVIYPGLISDSEDVVPFIIRMGDESIEDDPRLWTGQHRATDRSARPEVISASAIDDAYAADYEGFAVLRFPNGSLAIEVPQFTLSAILAEYERVDLIDMDVQGEEARIVAEGLPALNAKVRRLHIGTHGRAIEDSLKKTLTAAGWILVRDYACHSRQPTEYGMMDFVDGVQSWINPALHPRFAGVSPADVEEQEDSVSIPLELLKRSGESVLAWHAEGMSLITVPRLYSFGAYLPFELPDFGTDAVTVEVAINVEKGEIGVGWFDPDRKDWVSRETAMLGKSTVQLVVPANSPGQLIIDNRSADGPSHVIIEAITMLPGGEQ